jgi:hypothetical protein
MNKDYDMDSYHMGFFEGQRAAGRARAEEFVNIDDAQRAEMGLGPRTRPSDPAYFLLADGHTTKPVVHDPLCYICNDPEFAQMGLPLCRPCPHCREAGRGDGHVPADDTVCTECGHDECEREAMLDMVRAWAHSSPCHDDERYDSQRIYVVEEYAMVGGVGKVVGDGSPLYPDHVFWVRRWARTHVAYSWEWLDGFANWTSPA